mgnify:CR=1 FL=1
MLCWLAIWLKSSRVEATVVRRTYNIPDLPNQKRCLSDLSFAWLAGLAWVLESGIWNLECFPSTLPCLAQWVQRSNLKHGQDPRLDDPSISIPF